VTRVLYLVRKAPAGAEQRASGKARDMATPSSSSGGLPLRSALKSDDQPDKGSPLATAAKAVSIAEPDLVTLDEPQPRKQFTAGLGKKLNVRPQLSPRTNSQRITPAQAAALEGLSDLPDAAIGEESPRLGQQHHHHKHRIDRVTERLLAQVTEWIQHETRKASRRKLPRVSSHRREPEPRTTEGVVGSQQRSPSQDSASSQVSLDRLQRIVEDGMTALGLKTLPPLSPRLTARRHSTGRRRSSRSLQLHRTASSDTDFVDGDVLVPSSDAVIDNSGTLDGREEERRQAYVKFKDDIIRVAHTLKLKGWRRVPLDAGDTIEVERLSGALTNAVYVVSPPANLLAQPADGKRKPAKVLLRIYGPQVEHLIDRENELMVLRRLARKKIGPRLLGTFTNGRLEEFFNATTLTAADLRVPETSRQIAKRMRELHDGMDLLQEERDGGPAVWKNWDSWVTKVEMIAQYLDRQHAASVQANGFAHGKEDLWQRRGYVCGVEWSQFRAMVDKSRKMVNEYYGDRRKLREKLVFAHNDVSPIRLSTILMAGLT
jgi:choline kinase